MWKLMHYVSLTLYTNHSSINVKHKVNNKTYRLMLFNEVRSESKVFLIPFLKATLNIFLSYPERGLILSLQTLE